MGYRAIALTDHMDESNIDFIIPRVVEVAKKLNDAMSITVIAGTELTHVPPKNIPALIKEARKLGAKIVVVHGESIVEPVEHGTNAAAIEGGADIISHPGLISAEELSEAKGRGICLELTSRKGHSLSNGYIARRATESGIPLVMNTDSHSPSDLVTKEFAKRVVLSSGLDKNQVETVFSYAEELVRRIME
jgi:histidinol phosphatase-like PHP family hydrolase